MKYLVQIVLNTELRGTAEECPLVITPIEGTVDNAVYAGSFKTSVLMPKLRPAHTHAF